jgi:hypothetical protein
MELRQVLILRTAFFNCSSMLQAQLLNIGDLKSSSSQQSNFHAFRGPFWIQCANDSSALLLYSNIVLHIHIWTGDDSSVAVKLLGFLMIEKTLFVNIQSPSKILTDRQSKVLSITSLKYQRDWKTTHILHSDQSIDELQQFQNKIQLHPTKLPNRFLSQSFKL